MEEFPLVSFCLHNPTPGRSSFPYYQILLSTLMSWHDIWLCAFISQCWMSWHNEVLGVFLEENPTTTMNSNNLTIIYRGDYESFKNKPKPNTFQLIFASAEPQMCCVRSTATLHNRNDGPHWFQLKSFTFCKFYKTHEHGPIAEASLTLQ